MWGGAASGKDDSSGDGEQWLDSGYTLKLETTGFPDRLNVGCDGGGGEDELKLAPNFSHTGGWKND